MRSRRLQMGWQWRWTPGSRTPELFLPPRPTSWMTLRSGCLLTRVKRQRGRMTVLQVKVSLESSSTFSLAPKDDCGV
ncbi:hypothetical protein FKM82_024034 [Ascaphus truei]